ncbi:VTT domain-containing protein [Comamonas sp. GB3 AK4-5]|uniref:VTT domain-containing protein n=1 Tax=Comamonas sp. GB3 AK4-5 TaxID=3231487 RepID=UPI00351E3C82
MDFDTSTLRTALTLYAPGVVFANVLLQQLGLPLPVLPTLLLAGSLAPSLPRLAALLALALLAAMLADRAWYLVGQRFGSRVLAWMCKLSINPGSCISQTADRFGRWGAWSLLLAKFIPGFSAVAAPLAGVLRMPVARFTLAAAGGASLWAGLALGTGWLLRHQVDRALTMLQTHGPLLAMAAALLLVLWLGSKLWRRQLFLHLAAMPSVTAAQWAQAQSWERPPRLLDLRGPALVAELGEIANAQTVSLAQLPRLVRPWPRDTHIITLCACPHDATAARAAQRLRRLGFAHACHFQGGFDAWKTLQPVHAPADAVHAAQLQGA